MTIPNQVSSVMLATDGVTKVFALTGAGGALYFLAGSDLRATYKNAAGNVTNLVNGTDFTITGDGTAGAGSLTTTASSAYADIGAIQVWRATPITQPETYNENDGFPAATHNRAQDRGRLIDQDIARVASLAASQAALVAAQLAELSGLGGDVGSYIGAGAECVSMPAILKMRQSFSIDDYIGAPFDTAADYSATVAAAVADLIGVGGGTINLGPHAYLCNAPVPVNGHSVRILGVNRGRQERSGSAIYSSLGNHDIFQPGADGNSYDDFCLENFTLGNRWGITPTAGILANIAHSYAPSLRRMRLSNWYNGIYAAGVNGLLLDDLHAIRGVGAYAICLDETTYGGTNYKLEKVRLFPMEGTPGKQAITSTSQACATGALSFIAPTGQDLVAGQPFEIRDASNTAGVYMFGTITSYDPTTGALVVSISSTLSDTTTQFTSWMLYCRYRANTIGVWCKKASTLTANSCQFNRFEKGVRLEGAGTTDVTTFSEFYYFGKCEAEYCNYGYDLADFSRVLIEGGEIALSRTAALVTAELNGSGRGGTLTLNSVNIPNGGRNGIIHNGGRLEINNPLITGTGQIQSQNSPRAYTGAGLIATVGNISITAGKIGGSGNFGDANTGAIANYGIDLSGVSGSDTSPIIVNGTDLTNNNTAGINDPNALASLKVSDATVGYQDFGTAVASAGSATLNRRYGAVTTDSLTLASNALYSLTITNSKMTVNSAVAVNLYNGSNTITGLSIESVLPHNGSVKITIRNANPSNALNGTVMVNFKISP